MFSLSNYVFLSARHVCALRDVARRGSAAETHLNFRRRSKLHARHEKIVRITLVRRFVVPVTLMVMVVVVRMHGMLLLLLLLLVRWSTGHRCAAGSIVVHVRVVCTTTGRTYAATQRDRA